MINNWNVLILGDILAILAVTLIGFAKHGELDLSLLPRMLALFVPFVGLWLFFAPRYGLFKPEIVSDYKQLWRVLLVVAFVSWLTISARNALLIFFHAFQTSDGNLIFIPVLAVTSTFGLVLWRVAYLIFTRK